MCFVRLSIARGASRRDLVHRPIIDAPTSPVALAWRRDDENSLLDEFVGVVRGRSATSSRTLRAALATADAGAVRGRICWLPVNATRTG